MFDPICCWCLRNFVACQTGCVITMHIVYIDILNLKTVPSEEALGMYEATAFQKSGSSSNLLGKLPGIAKYIS